MKNIRVLSVLLSFILVFSIFSINASASEQNDVISFKIDKVSKDMISRSYAQITHKAVEKFVSASATDYKLYDSIPLDARTVYRQFIKDSAGLASTPQGHMEIDLSNFLSQYNSASLSIESQLSYTICYACAALSDDFPEFQWLLSAPFNITFDKSSGLLKLDVDMLRIPYKNWSEIERDYNNLLNAVDTFMITGETRYEKVKAIHDKLGNLACYSDDLNNNTDATNSKVFYPSSALLYPNKTVCDGYSKAFKMLCDKNGIPCIVVAGYGYTPDLFGIFLLGGGHAWNYVQMENGKWYAVDLTWDDRADGSLIYDYFLVGSSTVDSQGNKFGTTHDPVGDRFYDVYLKYPNLSTTKYVYTPPAPQPEPDTPSVVPYSLGDVNGDGKISVVDAKWVLQSIASLKELTNEQAVAADTNGDSKLSVIDAKWILQAVAGIRTFAVSK